MPNPRWRFLLIPALLAGCAPGPETATARDAGAPPAASATAVSTPVDDEAAVRTALNDFFDAAEKFDWKAVDGMLASDFEFYSDDAMVLGRQDFLDAMKDDNMKIQRLVVQNPRVILSEDGSLAWIKYQVELESTIHDEPYNMNSVETVVFRKEDGRWRMTHNHASVKQLP